ncbi:HAD-IIA family hydrolase [Tsukamurella soli]
MAGSSAAHAVGRGVLFDIDGVLVTSWSPLPGAREALEWVRARGARRAFLTNTTSKTGDDIAGALRACGLDVDGGEIVTAARLTGEYLRGAYPGARVHVLTDGPVGDLGAGFELVPADAAAPDVVVLGGAGPAFTHYALSRVFEFMLAGVPVVAMHRSNAWATAEGQRIDTGLYLEGLCRATGVTPTVIGKPSPVGFRAAAELMGLDPTAIVMVGDDVRADVLAGQVSGMTGVLVRTGKFRQAALDTVEGDEFGLVPDHVIDGVGDLPTLLADLWGC